MENKKQSTGNAVLFRILPEEMQKIRQEILIQTPPSYTTLLRLVYERLRPTVARFCRQDMRMEGDSHTDDVMQAVCVRLLQTVVPRYFLRAGTEAAGSTDADAFAAWIVTVAHNVQRDYAQAEYRRRVRELPLAEEAENFLPDEDTRQDGEAEYAGELLCRAYAVVLQADAQVYKVLTWLAYSLFMIEADLSGKESKAAVCRAFSGKTLYEMRDILISASAKLPWLSLSKEQKARIDIQLEKPFDGQKTYGETTYSTFFMKKGGKATISDWVNRMNEQIRRVLANEASDC